MKCSGSSRSAACSRHLAASSVRTGQTALGRFATPEERREIRLQERAKMRTSTPYYDMTFSAEKSVSLMYAGLLAAAKRARDNGDEREAERFRAEAKQVEAAVMAGADLLLEYRQIYGRAPDRATLYKLRKRVTLETRKAKQKPELAGAETPRDRERAAGEALAAWIRTARDASVQALDSLHEAAGAYAVE